MERLTCVECGYQNEPERIYCHNCGAKLDRSLLPRKDDKAKTKKKSKVPVGKVKVRTPILKPFLISLISAAGAAAILLAVMPPDDPPPLENEPLLQSPDIGVELNTLASSPRRAFLTYSEDQVNSYLKTTVRGGRDDALATYIEYAGTFADLRDGAARIYLVQRVLGYPVYIHKTFEPVTTGGGEVRARTVNCGIGRLDLPAITAPAIDLVLGALWDAARRDIETMGRLGGVRIGKDQVTFLNKGS